MKKILILALFFATIFTNTIFATENVGATVEVYDLNSAYSALVNAIFSRQDHITLKSKYDFMTLINSAEVINKAVSIDEYRGYNAYGVFPTLRKEGEYYYADFAFSLYSSEWEESEITKRAAAMALDMEGLTDYQKIKAVHDYLVLQGEYVIFGQGAYAAMFQGMTACNGYAMAFKRVMDEVNIPCHVNVGDSHMWNTVYVDGYWYNIDVTWDDLGGKAIGYDYFLKCNADWSGHASSNSDAPASYTFDNYKFTFPNYNLYNMGIKAAIPLFAIFIILAVYSLVRHRKTKVITYVDVPEWEYNTYQNPEDYFEDIAKEKEESEQNKEDGQY